MVDNATDAYATFKRNLKEIVSLAKKRRLDEQRGIISFNLQSLAQQYKATLVSLKLFLRSAKEGHDLAVFKPTCVQIRMHLMAYDAFFRSVRKPDSAYVALMDFRRLSAEHEQPLEENAKPILTVDP